MYIEWEQPKPKEILTELISFGMDKEKALQIGKGQAKFYLYLADKKRHMKADELTRFREELQRDISSLENRKIATDDLRLFYAGRIGDIDRAIRYAVHKYQKTRNANPKTASKEGLKEKRSLDHAIEKHLRKRSY